MNIFEQLGLPKDHRRHPVQLVKHLDEVPDSRKHDGLYMLQVKYDGVYGIVMKKGDVVIAFNRTGKEMPYCDLITKSFESWPDGMYMGEITCKGLSLEVLSGIINPNRVNPILPDLYGHLSDNIRFMVFDFIYVEEFIRGDSVIGCNERYEYLKFLYEEALEKGVVHLVTTSYHIIEECKIFIDAMIKSGHEGGVIKHMNAPWKAGHKGWHQMKIVRGVSYDLECIAWEEGAGKYEGKVANLVFRWKDGKYITAMLGKGWTHDMAEHMFNEINKVGEHCVVGCIYEVYALQESSMGVLRLPKVGSYRHDKEDADV
jgi:ATP-dependent DNA ligase